jgi:hypothetical protein
MTRMEFTESISNHLSDPQENQTLLPPAILQSDDQTTYFSMQLIRWETPLLPCTRYDEWLVCRLTLSHKKDGLTKTLSEEGPFLLRHEVEEIFTAVQTILRSPEKQFRSDFLEPILIFQLQPSPLRLSSNAIAQVNISLKAPNPGQSTSSKHPTSNLQEMTFQVAAPELQTFSQQLAQHLDAFPSLL